MQHTIQEVKEVDRLWDEMSLAKVSEKTGIPYSTLLHWSTQGWISTEIDWVAKGNAHAPDGSVAEKVNRMWEHMPLTEISEVLDIPLNTLRDWSYKGWISTDRDWAARSRQKIDKWRRAADLYYEHHMTQYEVAEEMDVSQTTVSDYLKKYKEMEK